MIEKLKSETIKDCYVLAGKLWSGLNQEEFIKGLMDNLTAKRKVCYLYMDVNKAVGFVQASIRVDYVEGSESSPVAYIEGIYVEPNYRKDGIAKALIKSCEAWGKSNGCTELGSDCELNNSLSINFHKGIGFIEANRLVCFIKPLD